jgi:hypothetical protein
MTLQDLKLKIKTGLGRLGRAKKPAPASHSLVDRIEPDDSTAQQSELAALALPAAEQLQAADASPVMGDQPVSAKKAKIQALLKAKLAKLLPNKKTAPGAEAEAEAEAALLRVPASQAVKINQHHFVFGLDWRFFTDSKDLSRTVRGAKRDGFDHQVVAQTDDLVGIGRIPTPPKKARLYSASLHLSQSVSRGGMELFVFKLDADLFCLVALNDSRPIIGFEKAGTRSDIMTLAGEFQLSQVGYTIRQAGNTGALEHEEPIKLTEAFGPPDDNTRVKAIPDYKIIALKVAAVVGIGVMGFFIYGYINEAKIKAAAERLARERDPNFLYEREVEASMKKTGLSAQEQMERWRATIQDIPVSRQGWRLTDIACQPEQCTLNWSRDYGSYTEFFAVPLAHEVRSTESQAANNPASSNIQTVLTVPAAPVAAGGLDRKQLPGLPQIQRLLASQLQDLSLLENSSVELKNAELYPAPAGLKAAQINKPVVRGEWTIAHEIWSLNDLSFSIPGLVAESLSIAQPEKSNSWVYTLKGRYYAKGKDF